MVNNKKYNLTDEQYENIWVAINKQAILDYIYLRKNHIKSYEDFSIDDIKQFFIDESLNGQGLEIYNYINNYCNEKYGVRVNNINKNKNKNNKNKNNINKNNIITLLEKHKKKLNI